MLGDDDDDEEEDAKEDNDDAEEDTKEENLIPDRVTPVSGSIIWTINVKIRRQSETTLETVFNPSLIRGGLNYLHVGMCVVLTLQYTLTKRYQTLPSLGISVHCYTRAYQCTAGQSAAGHAGHRAIWPAESEAADYSTDYCEAYWR